MSDLGNVQTKRNDRGILVTFLKVRQLSSFPELSALGKPRGGMFAVIYSNDRRFEPSGSHWPHLARFYEKSAAESYARAACKPHPEHGDWYEFVE